MPKRFSKNRRIADRKRLQEAEAQVHWAVGGLWSISSVTDEPETVLSGWHVFEVKLPGKTERTRHFAGCVDYYREGRASSAIQVFDPATMRGVTESGRTYQLTRSRGFTADGRYTWQQWCRICSATDIVDVSDEIEAAVANAGAYESRKAGNESL